MKMLKNLTPHEVKIITGEGTIVVKPSGVVARCNEHEELAKDLAKDLAGIPVIRLVLGEVVDLPPEEEGVTLIVSHIVLQACPKRKDLVKPGKPVRNAAGEIIGCLGLSVLGNNS